MDGAEVRDYVLPNSAPIFGWSALSQSVGRYFNIVHTHVEVISANLHKLDSRYNHINRKGGSMVVTNMFLNQEKIAKYGMKLASGRKSCGIC